MINLAEEYKKTPFSEQYYKITNFLGCPNITNLPMVQANAAKQNQIDFFPKDHVINWQNYSFPEKVQRILNFIKQRNGTYDYEQWNELKQLYGTIYSEKKRSIP